VEPLIGAFASGTRSPASRCNVLTQVRNGKLKSQRVSIINNSTFSGSQVCNLAWSKHSSELVSTHGYSQNQILVWKYPSLTQVAKLTGHSYRVLYLALSPDGEAIVTGAGDETLRFWNVFSKARSQKENKSVLNLFTNIR
jgi:WD40 repeat protein